MAILTRRRRTLTMAEQTYELPNSDSSTEEFWTAANRRELLIKRCDACGRPHFYPRPFCPHCWSTDVRWEAASGQATVYSFSVVRQNDTPQFANRVPYIAAIVELAEGPRMTTNLVGVDSAEVHVGMAVTVDFSPAGPDGASLVPVFRPRQ
jgi:uncharacterized OB-fold protein